MKAQELQALVSQVCEPKQTIAAHLVEELAFIEETLEQLKGEIRENGVVENFKQGKQEFQRESPALKSYTTLIGKYATLQKQLSDLLPTEEDVLNDELEEFNSCL